MDVYLMRHGQAVPREQDPAQSLSEAGRAAATRVAARAAAAGMRVDRVYHSGIARARQTADVLAEHLGAMDRLEARQGLAPNDPVDPIAYWLTAGSGPGGERAVALVGHLPFMERLVSRLAGVSEDEQVVILQPASLVKLVPRLQGGYALAWLLAPEIA